MELEKKLAIKKARTNKLIALLRKRLVKIKDLKKRFPNNRNFEFMVFLIKAQISELQTMDSSSVIQLLTQRQSDTSMARPKSGTLISNAIKKKLNRDFVIIDNYKREKAKIALQEKLDAITRREEIRAEAKASRIQQGITSNDNEARIARQQAEFDANAALIQEGVCVIYD